jgi:hypothetical protein
MKGFKRSRSIHIQVLFDALPLEGVPTRVTRVANRCALEYLLYFLRLLLPDHRFMRVMIDLCSFKTSEYISTLKKINPQFSANSDTTGFYKIVCITKIFVN